MITWKIASSDSVEKVYMAPGNTGTKNNAEGEIVTTVRRILSVTALADTIVKVQ